MYAKLSAERIATRLEGPLLFLKRVVDVGLKDSVRVHGADGIVRPGRVAALTEDTAIVEVLAPTVGLDLPGTRIEFVGEPPRFSVGEGLLGRIFNGVGEVIDGGPPIAATERRSIEGLAMNPAQRATPRDFIQTGISTIDVLNSLVRGQKLPIFSGGGLPHDRIATHIATHAQLRGRDEQFAIVFAGIGIAFETAEYFRKTLESSGVLERTVLFLNLASDASAQRLLTPRFALTAAEYLAFERGMHVLAIITDMTNYCEALREVSTSLGEIPSRKGYPGYLYSDLATLYERAGRFRNRPGTLTQLPILTMPADDIGHPIPDLTGYITEGQVVLDRDLDRAGLFPPVKVLPSLSRLMKDGTGGDYTHPDHPALASQLYAAYARGVQSRVLASVVGEEGLSETDRGYLTFASAFEERFVNQIETRDDQRQTQARTLEASMDVGWELLALLPRTELHRLSDAQIARYLKAA